MQLIVLHQLFPSKCSAFAHQVKPVKSPACKSKPMESKTLQSCRNNNAGLSANKPQTQVLFRDQPEIAGGSIESLEYLNHQIQTCSISIRVPAKSLGCRNNTGFPCAPIFGFPSPRILIPLEASLSLALSISSTSKQRW